jgi:hypothetical protein
LYVPYSDIVAFGNLSISPHQPNHRAIKAPHVRHVFTCEQVVSFLINGQIPSLESELHAKYGWQVSYGTWPILWIKSNVPECDPPWQEPAMSLPQFKTNWIERLMSSPWALRAILMRSARLLSAPWAQQEPQYW